MLISESLEKYLSSKRLREESEVKDKKFYISDMGKCLRMRWAKRKGIASEFEPYVNWIFEIGDMFHDFGYKALEAQGILLESEDSMETEHFKGRHDGIIKTLEGKCIFDFKSTGAWKLNKYIGGDDDEENIAQVLSYLMILKDKRKDLQDTAYVSYINKEPGDKCPVISFDKEYHLTSWRAKKLQEEMDTLIEFWVKDKIPPCTCPAWAKPYNSYQPICSNTDKAVRGYLEYLKAGKKLISTKTTLYLIDGEIKKEVLKI